MVFEIIKKGLRGFPIGEEMISIAKTTISLGKNITDESLKYGFIEVYVDRDLNLVGFKFSKDNIRGFKLLRRENSLSRINAKLISSIIPTGSYDAKKEDNMWIIKVSEIAKK